MGKREFKYTLNKSHLKAIFALCLFIFSAHSLAAQNRWWVAIDDGTDKYWDDNANWSTTQYGNGGASAPLPIILLLFSQAPALLMLSCELISTKLTNSNY